MADYVVSTWDEFLQHNTSGDTVKFGNPHEVNGAIVLEGDGSQSNPYVVSTYEEMLFATGATYIWEVKLIDREGKLYRYNDIYCRYDDTLTTIDFNQIQPEGYDENLVINAAVNGNGWTWKNMVFNDKYLSYNNASPLSNIRIINLYTSRFSDYYSVIRIVGTGGITNSILDIHANSSSNNRPPIIYTSSELAKCEKSVVQLTLRGNSFSLSTDYYTHLRNCVLILDVDTSKFWIGSNYSPYYGAALTNVLIKGSIKTSSDDDVIKLGYAIKSCIYDIDYTGNGKLAVESTAVKSVSFYNSDKVSDETGLAVANMTGATTEELKSAQFLFEHGLPIAWG